MAEFEKRLDASISEAQERGRLSDELYQKYLQFVGVIEALPQDQIAVDKAGTDIHDIYGRIKPLSQWPTKSGRARSEKVWLNYNQRLQLKQAAKEGGTAPEDPTDDPDFLGQFLDTCVRTSMRTGIDKNTAFRHCSRQAKRFEEAVRTALADRGLTKKQVEEFTQDLLKGMANGKTIDMKDLSIEDRQFIQDLKDSLTYKSKNESVVREDLEDVDEFELCEYSDCKTKNDATFHAAHTQAASLGDIAYKRSSKYADFVRVFDITMNDAGYIKVPGQERWTKKADSLKEDLDDKDAFRADCNYYNCDERSDSEQFHNAHTLAHQNALKIPPTGRKFSDVIQQEMQKFGYRLVDTGKMLNYGGPWNRLDWVLKEGIETERPTPTIILPNMKTLAKGDWIELGPPAKLPSSGEGLDDQDEFSRDRDLPITPVQIVDISEVPSYRRDPKFTAPLRVRLNNHNLLSLPDASGVRWHGRPKHHEPAWFQPWYGSYSDWDLETMFSDGELRIIDNIEQWFQSQSEE